MKAMSIIAAAVMAASVIALPALAQDAGTLKKIKDSGAVTMGVRESSGGLSFSSVTASSPASTSNSASTCLPTSRNGSGWPGSTSSTSRSPRRTASR